MLQLCTIRVEQALKSPEKSLPAELRETSTKVRHGPFLRTVDKILEALEGQVIPHHSELASIACEGKVDQNCTVCRKEITVDRIWSFPSVDATVRLYALEGEVTFSCGSLSLAFGPKGCVPLLPN